MSSNDVTEVVVDLLKIYPREPDIKSKSKEDKIELLAESFKKQIKLKCVELDLELTDRYEIVKRIMVGLKLEVKDYAENLKDSLNESDVISEDMDVEDMPLIEINTYSDVNESKIVSVFMESELGKYIKEGCLNFEYTLEKLHAINSSGERFTISEFEPNNFKSIVSKLYVESGIRVDLNKEFKIRISNLSFNSIGITGNGNDFFNLDIK